LGGKNTPHANEWKHQRVLDNLDLPNELLDLVSNQIDFGLNRVRINSSISLSLSSFLVRIDF